jgi:hypothetical protein
MSHAIIRGKGGRRHEVDFGDAPIRVEVHASEETVEGPGHAFRPHGERDAAPLANSCDEVRDHG